MPRLICTRENVTTQDAQALIRLCPFGAVECLEGRILVNAACKMCGICVKKGPAGLMQITEESEPLLDKNAWRGVGVYADHDGGRLHPVTLELIGKAIELAAPFHFPVFCVLIGRRVGSLAEELRHYGVDEVFVYDDEALANFRIEPYAAAMEDFIRRVRPSSLLVGATAAGRSLAPRVAARFRTGLTADCTMLEMKENTDLVQIRPAFGGNIMARILCTHSRPQIATVRYKVMNAPERLCDARGKITFCSIPSSALVSGIEICQIVKKEAQENLSDAKVIVAVGRGFRTEKDLTLARELAGFLGAKVAGTRPMIEKGFLDSRCQIGLSGRTVKPRLILTLGISGSVQFAAGMGGSECIFAVNKDPNAPIFQIAHYGIVGDLYEILPRLTAALKESGRESPV